MTYGELRLRLKQQFQGVDLELLSGWIADRCLGAPGAAPRVLVRVK